MVHDFSKAFNEILHDLLIRDSIKYGLNDLTIRYSWPENHFYCICSSVVVHQTGKRYPKDQSWSYFSRSFSIFIKIFLFLCMHVCTRASVHEHM